MSKTGHGLAAWAESIIQGGNHVYWYGTYCNPCTTSLLKGKTGQYPSHYGSDRQATYKKHIQQGKICTDCVGLIKGYYWEADGVVKYKRDGLPDKGAKSMWSAAQIKGKIATLPEIPGLLVWTKDQGHVGVYVGGGYVVEARGFSYGVQRNALTARAFTHWGMCPYIDYTAAETETAYAAMGGAQKEEAPGKAPGTAQDAPEAQGGVDMPTIRNGQHGTAVRVMQRLLMLQGAKLSGHGADGKFGSETEKAVKAFQTAHNLNPDGICGPLTWAALAG